MDGPAPPPVFERTVSASKADLTEEPARYVVAWLLALSGPARGRSFEVRNGRNVIGRDPKSDVRLSDDQASAHHADLVFRPEEQRFILMDHNSTNGTFVNDEEIEPRRDLVNGDVIRIGSQKLMFYKFDLPGFTWEAQDHSR